MTFRVRGPSMVELSALSLVRKMAGELLSGRARASPGPPVSYNERYRDMLVVWDSPASRSAPERGRQPGGSRQRDRRQIGFILVVWVPYIKI